MIDKENVIINYEEAKQQVIEQLALEQFLKENNLKERDLY